MKAKRLKEIISVLDDEIEVFIRNSANPCGNIQELEQVEVDTYGFFGVNIPCAILNTDSSKKLEHTGNDEIVDFKNNK